MDAVVMKLHDELLQRKPGDATHDETACEVCKTEGAETTDTAARDHNQDTQERSTVADETKEAQASVPADAHAALVEKAVAEQTSELRSQVGTLTTERDELKGKIETLESENAELNRKVDDSEIKVKSAEDETASLKEKVESMSEADKLREVATERAKQVRELSIFKSEYVDEKAEVWAKIGDEEWAERLEEWKQASAEASNSEGDDKTKTETATAITGSTDDDNVNKSARRAVLGLAS